VSASVRRDLALIILGGLGLRLLFIANPGHLVDLRTFGQWALAAADHPWNRAYEVTDANYPPGALVVFELIGRAYRALGLADALSLRIALKLPNIIFDSIGTGVLYAIAARFVDGRRALIAPALYAFNPAIIYDSALWGQNDSITTVTMLGAVWCVLGRRPINAWILLALAVLNKPPVIVLAPLFVVHALVTPNGTRRTALIRTAGGIGAALVCGYVLALPFYTERAPLAVYERMISWYEIGSSLYPFTSANGFNIYAFGGDFFAPDTQPLAFVPIKYWADAAFIGLAAFIAWAYARARDDRAFVTACFLTLLGFFLVLTEMHERYLMYALTVVPALAPLDRRFWWSAIALTITQWLNLEYALTYMWIESDKPAGVDPHEFAPVLAQLCAFTNIAVFVAGMQRLVRPGVEPIPRQGR
jgi:dolichyl-phosphate-mannose-protein mannosyltransferase